jgi:hypothetical protein
MVVFTTADEEGLIIKDRDIREQMCAGRMVNVSDTSSLSLDVKGITNSESLGGGTGVVSLGGINPAVHITSELMYRACELVLNLNLVDQDSSQIFDAALDAVIKISSHYQTSTVTDSAVSTPSYDSDNTDTSDAIDDTDDTDDIEDTDTSSDPSDQ